MAVFVTNEIRRCRGFSTGDASGFKSFGAAIVSSVKRDGAFECNCRREYF